MKRFTIYFMLITAALTFAHCPAFYSINKKESKLYTAEQTVILEKTTKALEYDFAYDPDVNLDYIFEFNKNKRDLAKAERELNKTADTIKLETFINFYEKIYSLKLLTQIRLEEYRSDEEWKYVTYIEKYLLPPLNGYLASLEKYVANKDREYGKTLPEKKKAVEKRLHLQLRREKADKEFEEQHQ